MGVFMKKSKSKVVVNEIDRLVLLKILEKKSGGVKTKPKVKKKTAFQIAFENAKGVES